MKLRSLLVIGATGMLTLGVALPATALPGDQLTPVQMTVTGGALAITAPTGTASTVFLSGSSGSTVSASLGQIQVTDARSLPAGGWIASVSTTPLVPILGGTNILPAAIGYEIGSGGITQVGIATYVHTPAATASLAAAAAVITASLVNLDNSATWTPDLKVTVPAGMAAGTYRATITHSVA